MTTIGVVIATYGSAAWADLALSRALPSVVTQTRAPEQVEIVHAQTLHEARNEGVEELRTDWVIHLDADDELDAGYIAEMHAVVEPGLMLQPATLGVYADGSTDAAPVVIPAKRSLLEGNWLVVGTMVERERVLRNGGWLDWPAWEDWCLWIRLALDGARPVPVPEAIYRVHIPADGGRNNVTPRDGAQLGIAIRGRYRAAAHKRGWAA